MTFTYDTAAANAGAHRADQDAHEPRPSLRAAVVGWIVQFWGPSPAKELPDFTRQLATLLLAGSNTADALETLGPEILSPRLRKAVEALELATKRGLPLHKAMRAHPKVFDRVYTEIVAAGVQAGTLPEMLEPLAAGLISAEKVRSKITRAMIQPLFTLSATFLGGWYMLQAVVPTFAAIYEREGVELPFVTRMLIGIGNFASAAGDAAFIGAGIFLLILPKVLATPAVRAVTDRLLLRIPIVGPLQTMGSVARFMRFFSMLVSSNPGNETRALELAAQTAPNSAIAHRLSGAALDVAAGTKKVSGALARTGVVPRTSIQILRTGELTGQDAQMAAYAADRLEEKVMVQVENAQEALVPLVMCVVIAMVALLMLGLWSPMAKLYEVLLQ